MQLDEDLRDGYESGRGHSIWRKPWTQGSALPLHATSRQTVAHDGGSSRITDGVSSLVHPHHAHHGQGRSVVAHSVRTPTLSALSEPSEMQQGENGQYPYSLTLAQRIDASIPTHIDVTSSLPRMGCNGWTMHDFECEAGVTLTDFSTGVTEAPWKVGQNSPTATQTTGTLSAPAETYTTGRPFDSSVREIDIGR